MQHLHLSKAMVLLLVMLASCTINVPQRETQQPVQRTQLQTREFQRREFDTNDVNLVMKAALNVLQDDDFVVRNAVSDLGLLSAIKEIDLNRNTGTVGRRDGESFWQTFFRSLADDEPRNRNNRNNNQWQQPRTRSFKQIEASINVTGRAKSSTVRANFQVRILDADGKPLEVYTVEDPRFYQEFFSKMDKGIFLQKEGF